MLKKGSNVKEVVINSNVSISITAETNQDKIFLPSIKSSINEHSFRQFFKIINGKTLISKDVVFSDRLHRYNTESLFTYRPNSAIPVYGYNPFPGVIDVPVHYRHLIIEGPINRIVLSGKSIGGSSTHSGYAYYLNPSQGRPGIPPFTSSESTPYPKYVFNVQFETEVDSYISSESLTHQFKFKSARDEYEITNNRDVIAAAQEGGVNAFRELHYDSETLLDLDKDITINASSKTVLKLTSKEEYKPRIDPNEGWLPGDLGGGLGEPYDDWILVRTTFKEEYRYVYGKYRWMYARGLMGLANKEGYAAVICQEFTNFANTPSAGDMYWVMTVCNEGGALTDCGPVAFQGTSADWPGVALSSPRGGLIDGSTVWGRLWGGGFSPVLRVDYIIDESLTYTDNLGNHIDPDDQSYIADGIVAQCESTTTSSYKVNGTEIPRERLIVPDYLDLNIEICQSNLGEIKSLKLSDGDGNSTVTITLLTTTERFFSKLPF